MKTYYPYDAANPKPIYGEQHTIQDGRILLDHIPYVNSIVIAGFKQTLSVVVQPGQFRCNYDTEDFYREADCTVYFNQQHDGESVSVDYLQVGTILIADDLNEVKAHLEDNSIHNRYTLPIASPDTRGGVRIGNGLTMLGDILSVDSSQQTLPVATRNLLGGVKVGEGLAVTGDGLLSSTVTDYTLPAASSTQLGGVKVGNTLSVINDTLDYYLPVASSTQLGGVKIGSGLSISNGVLSADSVEPYTLPTASSTQLGGVKVGSGLSITNGVLSADSVEPYTLPTASSTQLGGVKVGSGLSISNGVLSVTLDTSGGVEFLTDEDVEDLIERYFGSGSTNTP